MRPWLWRPWIALALLVAASAAAEAQIDLSKMLVGRWEGDVQMADGTFPRTLIIKSIRQTEAGMVIEAEYGGLGGYGGGQVIQPIRLAIEAYGKNVILRFQTVEAWRVELSLYRDQRHLLGNLSIPADRGAWGINPVKLTKVG